MPLCDYGCGQEAIYKLKNGRWCCSQYAIQCPIVKTNNAKSKKEYFKNESDNDRKERILRHKTSHNTDDFKNKQSLALKKYYKETPNARSKNSVAVKKYFNNEPPDKKAERIRKHIESHSSASYRLNASIKSKRTIEQTQKKYPIFAIEEEMRYNPDKPGEKEIQVHCKNNNFPNSKEKGGWFTPTSTQIINRIMDLDGKKACGGSYFYCSEKCKSSCEILRTI